MSTEFKDYYAILGVPDNADAETIKKSYRKLARQYHPDVSKEADAAKRFTDITEAYEVLGDPAKRQEYDQLRKHGWRGGDRFERPEGWQFQEAPGTFGGAGFAAEDFSDFFESLFGGRGRGRGPRGGGASPFQQRGRDRHARLPVTLDESYHGAHKTFDIDKVETDASGRPTTRRQSIQVRIPKGVIDGEAIRLRGQGDAGAGGTAGDLYLEVVMQPHPLFTADGKDLYLHLPVAPWEAALGAEVSVPTLAGTARLRIPAGSKADDRLRLRGQGLPGSPEGNLIVILRIAMPAAPSGHQRDLWQQLAQASTFDARAGWEGRQ
ncbi:MAG: DnaJ C-terminal domain-containing protein [Planctomycetota bacterium]